MVRSAVVRLSPVNMINRCISVRISSSAAVSPSAMPPPVHKALMQDRFVITLSPVYMALGAVFGKGLQVASVNGSVQNVVSVRGGLRRVWIGMTIAIGVLISIYKIWIRIVVKLAMRRNIQAVCSASYNH
jgi:hypothetical protein